MKEEAKRTRLRKTALAAMLAGACALTRRVLRKGALELSTKGNTGRACSEAASEARRGTDVASAPLRSRGTRKTWRVR